MKLLIVLSFLLYSPALFAWNWFVQMEHGQGGTFDEAANPGAMIELQYRTTANWNSFSSNLLMDATNLVHARGISQFSSWQSPAPPFYQGDSSPNWRLVLYLGDGSAVTRTLAQGRLALVEGVMPDLNVTVEDSLAWIRQANPGTGCGGNEYDRPEIEWSASGDNEGSSEKLRPFSGSTRGQLMEFKGVTPEDRKFWEPNVLRWRYHFRLSLPAGGDDEKKFVQPKMRFSSKEGVQEAAIEDWQEKGSGDSRVVEFSVAAPANMVWNEKIGMFKMGTNSSITKDYEDNTERDDDVNWHGGFNKDRKSISRLHWYSAVDSEEEDIDRMLHSIEFINMGELPALNLEAVEDDKVYAVIETTHDDEDEQMDVRLHDKGDENQDKDEEAELPSNLGQLPSDRPGANTSGIKGTKGTLTTAIGDLLGQDLEGLQEAEENPTITVPWSQAYAGFEDWEFNLNHEPWKHYMDIWQNLCRFMIAVFFVWLSAITAVKTIGI